ncbi:MAG TPA: vWA domain-containing protein [Myxococcota bacterium]
MGRFVTVGLAALLGALLPLFAARPAGEQPLSDDFRPAPLATPRLDLAIAIDVSGSAAAASGLDVDGDGETGVNPRLDDRLRDQYPKGVLSTDPDDLVLAAELAAVRALLEGLEGADVRVAVVAYSGQVDPEQGVQLGPPEGNARLAAPLGPPADALAALDEIARRGPGGGTDFAAGIRAARAALCDGAARPGAERRLLFLTDGVPSLPYGHATRTDPSDVYLAITAAKEAAACGIRIDVFAIGLGALGDPFASKEVARVTGGTYRAIRTTGGLAPALREAVAAR